MDYSGSDLAIVVPIWKRTENLSRLVCSVIDTVPDAEVWFVANIDDVGVHEPVDQLRRDLYGSLSTALALVDWPGGATGDYARKINHGYRFSDRPVIFTGADDVEFLDGWYENSRPYLSADVVEGGVEQATGWIGVVGMVDDCNARTLSGDLSTHSLVARWYANLGTIDVPASIYCEDYPHEYVDDELVETAKARGAYAHAYDAMIRHHHPNAGRAELDDVYAHGRSRTRESRLIFQRRRRLWTPAGPMPGVVQVSRPR